jgi:hypothetical protein
MNSKCPICGPACDGSGKNHGFVKIGFSGDIAINNTTTANIIFRSLNILACKGCGVIMLDDESLEKAKQIEERFAI